MKSSFALFVATCLTLAMVSAPVAAESMASPKKVAGMANMWGETPTPHFHTSGKPISAARGEQVFVDHCALCHGLHGKGDGPRSAFFQPGVQYIADLSQAAVLKGRDVEALKSIREGLQRFPEPAYVMPQFKYILSEEEIRSAFAYVKTLPALSARH